jgi:succinate dehydrogenase flavin-adding protein (antitoxin of CptAB toxin-antitoxin module)
VSPYQIGGPTQRGYLAVDRSFRDFSEHPWRQLHQSALRQFHHFPQRDHRLDGLIVLRRQSAKLLDGSQMKN